MAPRYSRNLFRSSLWLFVLAAWIVLRIALEWRASPPDEILVEGDYRVDYVVDGDTLRLVSGVRVRLQGIDTPETVDRNSPVEPWGPEATTFAKHFVSDAHQKIRLTFGKERIDRYGRQLAFVWNGETLLNEELVRAGLARARLDYRYAGKMKRRLAAAEAEARQAARGIWSEASE